MRRVSRCDNMASLGFSRKRSHDDVDDGDECLPISKRINSLHIEGQSTASLQSGHASTLPEDHQDSYPCMSSASPDPRSDSLVPGSPEYYAASMVQYRHSGIPRLPRIDEHVYQDVQAFQESDNTGRMDQKTSYSVNDSSLGNYAQETSCPQYLHNHSGSMTPSMQNNLMNNAYQHNFLAHNSDASTHPFTSLPQVTFPHSSQRAALMTHQNQSQGYYHGDSHNCLNSGQHQHPSIPHNPQHAGTIHSMESRQNLAYSNGLCIDHHCQQLLQTDQEGPQTNHVTFGENIDNDSRLSYEEPHIDSISNFQREQLPSGHYEPELSMTENPFYFSVNQMLYEAHVSRVRRLNQFPGGS